MTVPPPDYHGHRARLRQRLVETGGDGMPDYELIEYLLGLATPRVDTKPLAKKLIDEFGGIGGLMAAEPEALKRVKGMGETSIAALKIAQATALRMLRNELEKRDVLSNWQAVLDYLRAEMAHHPIERVRVLHLNSRNVLIRDDLVSEGTTAEAAVHVREIIKKAIHLGSAAIILVHNHPSGDPQPSRADIDLTRKTIEAAKQFDIAVHDHVVIGTKGHASLRAMGLM
jgi:DNA repair protein RadC